MIARCDIQLDHLVTFWTESNDVEAAQQARVT
jgi:hypothetical protein